MQGLGAARGNVPEKERFIGILETREVEFAAPEKDTYSTWIDSSSKFTDKGKLIDEWLKIYT